ncbi:leucine-rich repeat domain-containing protein [[Clostridium] hylemonae]|uniref:leucine-rich repeat domain-containing protein n=1 Tax=[Clostridium] hylemonae TaxID=89153 RepID=UPI001FCB6C59|nr:leucine-rich repeat domain-containing protein [[Clostridium] hylemonae]
MMKVEMRMKKRLGFVLCAALLFCGNVPAVAFAANDGCTHVHDGSCGYVSAVEGAPCGHVHDESCGGLPVRGSVPTDYEDGGGAASNSDTGTPAVQAETAAGVILPAATERDAPADTFEAGGLEYKVLTSGADLRTVSLTGWGAGGAQATLAIPATVQDGGGNTYKVTEIAERAFAGGTAATTLDITGAVNLVQIHDNAFDSWKNLTANGLDLSGLTSLTTIGSAAFYECGFTGGLNLTGLTSLTTIGGDAFANCRFTGGLDVSGLKNLTTIGAYAFKNCGFTGGLDLSGLKNLTTIGAYAFDDCGFTGGLDVSGLKNLTTIGSRAFQNCGFTGGLDLSDLTNLTTIGESAFDGCGFTGGLDVSGLTNLTTIGVYVFFGCGFSSVRLPAQMTVIPPGLFAGCGNLAAAELPSGLTRIGVDAFSYCGFTGTLDLSGYARLTTISGDAFSGNAALTEVRLPAGLTSLGDRAFQECASLTSLRFYGADAPAIGSYILSKVAANATTGTVYYPFGGAGYSADAFDSGKDLAQFGRWTFTTFNATAPVLKAGTAVRTSDMAANVTFTSSRAGWYYYAVVDSGAARPAIDTTGGGRACGTGLQTIRLTTLSAGAKDIYIVVKDADGNVSDRGFKIPIPAFTMPGKGTAETGTADGAPHTRNITINSDTVPQTGDPADILPWLVIIVAVLLGCASLAAYRKCRGTKRRE